MKLVIYGIGPFSELMYHYLCEGDTYEVVAFCADKKFISENSILGVPIVSYEDVEKIYPPEQYKMLVAIGYSVMRDRKIMFDKAKGKGYELINYIHPSVKNYYKLGENNIILAGSVIEPFVEIGDNNIIWSMTLLGHHCKLGNHNYISAQCLIAGDVTVGDLCFIGNDVNMINSLTIANESYLVAGSNIRKSTKEFGMYIGGSAKYLKSHQETGIIIK